MNSNTEWILNQVNGFLITCADMTYQIKYRYLPSIRVWDSGLG